MCVFHVLREKRPQDAIASDSEEFEVPGLPDRVMVSRRQLPHHLKLKATEDDPLLELTRKVLEADEAGFGIVVNTFHELEPAYATHYRKHTDKAWHIGPVSLISGGTGPESHDCTKWLGSRKPNSVVYVCFGSMAIVQKPQTDQIAAALEDTGQDFVWVVGKEAEVDEKFEARTEGRGMVIRGWAPQVQILSHAAVGGFVTHCGWNSLMEGVAAGVPMVTWPLSAEQFFNEKLVAEVLEQADGREGGDRKGEDSEGGGAADGRGGRREDEEESEGVGGGGEEGG